MWGGLTLNHRPPRLVLVLELRLSADADDLGVVRAGRDEAVERVVRDTGVGVDDEHVLVGGKSQREGLKKSGAETHLVKLRIDTDDVLDLMVHLEFERVHLAVKVDAVEEAH